MRIHSIAMIAVAIALPASARQPTPASNAASPKVVDAVIGCRTIPDATQRLACFDSSVDALQSATAKKDVVVVDREEVRKTRRSLFGYNLTNMRLFSDGEGKSKSPTDQEDSEITATIRSAHEGADGNWVVELDDGAVWRQTDGNMIASAPKPGNIVTIHRGALGSYFMKIGKQPGVKARRES